MKFKIMGLDGNEPEYPDLNKFKLSRHNPRYTVLNGIDGKGLVTSIRNFNNYDKQEVAEELFSHEGDWKDLVRLADSIAGGFDSENESIILVPRADKKHYFVAEGNRRMLVLKIANEELSCPDLKKLRPSDSSENLTNDNDEDNTKEKLVKRRKQNYKKFKERLEEIQQQFQDKIISIHVSVKTSSSQVIKAIFSKHTAGNRPGMRNWSRGQYFLDLLSVFKKGYPDNKKDLQRIRQNLQREPSLLKADFKHAQFVRTVLKTKFNDNNEQIISEMQHKKITALQSNFALKRIRDAAGINQEDFKKNYFNFKFCTKSNISFEKDKRIKYDDVLRFTYEWWENGVITTRPIKKEHEGVFNPAVARLLESKWNKEFSEMTAEELKQVDVFLLPPEKISEYANEARRRKLIDEVERSETTETYITERNKLLEINDGLFLKLSKKEKH